MNVHPNAEEMITLGRKLWGAPNKKLSSRDDVRFGSHGSKSIRISTGEWYDHEAGAGGGYSNLFEKVHGYRPANGAQSDIVAIYDYPDEQGVLLFQVVRRVPKKFVQRHPDDNGGWIWNTKGVRRVLYRLPELLAADPSKPVYIVEGEKDVDNLRQLGLVATCRTRPISRRCAWHARLARKRSKS